MVKETIVDGRVEAVKLEADGWNLLTGAIDSVQKP